MKKLVLLHGALGASSQFFSWTNALEPHFDILTFDFEGHGKRAADDRPFRMEYFVENLVDFLDENGLSQTNVFGYSMGGYVALCAAATYPDRIGKIFTLGTKFAWTPESSARETRFLDPTKIKEKVPKFAEALEQRHRVPGWENMLRATAEMMTHLGESPDLGTAELNEIQHEVLIGLGDQDNMVSEEESKEAARDLPEGRFLLLEDTPHPIEKVDPDLVLPVLLDFF